MDYKKKLLEVWNESPVFDTHEHLGVWDQWKPQENTMTVEKIFKWNYISWVGSTEKNYKLMCEKLKRDIGTDAFTSLRAGIRAIYGDEFDPYPLSPKTLEALDQKIHEAYADPDHSFKVLQEIGNVRNIINDIPPVSWKNWEHPILQNTIRIDEVICPFRKEWTNQYINNSASHQINNYATSNGNSIDSLDDFEDNLDGYMSSLRASANVIKIGSAYARSLHFIVEENEDGKIDEIFSRMATKNSVFTEKEMLRWGNYVVTIMLGYATVERLPVQIHTGLATLFETDPRFLIDIIGSFKGVDFDLFHGGFPYHHSLPAVITYNEHAHANLCWMPFLSRSATESLLTTLLEFRSSGKVFAFGGDCQTVEGSLGALIMIKDIMSDVFVRFIEKGRITLEDAIDIGKNMLFNNAKKVYERVQN
jgi:uncharacterized protein